MKPSEALAKLRSRVNIEHYVGPHVTRVLEVACRDVPAELKVVEKPRKVAIKKSEK